MQYKTDNIFNNFSNALLAAGNIDKFNMMTIGWGMFGTVWGKPAATVYVRTSRYTHEFMDAGEYFTIHLFGQYSCYREELKTLGTTSGRDMDKMHASGLTPEPIPHGIDIREADRTILCKKLLTQRLDPRQLPENIQKRYYDGDAPHDMYIGEVVEMRQHEYINGENCVSKEGSDRLSWKACYTESNHKYTARTMATSREGQLQWVYEITKDIFDKLGTFVEGGECSCDLIEKGRLLYRMGDEIMGPPWERVVECDYQSICPWIDFKEKSDYIKKSR